MSGQFLNVAIASKLSWTGLGPVLNADIPSGHDALWPSGLASLPVIADGTIAIACLLMAIASVYVIQQRQDVPFKGLLWLFAAFVATCGMAHSFSIGTIWWPQSGLNGSFKAVTAALSLVMALGVVSRLPTVLARFSPGQLEPANQPWSEAVTASKAAAAKSQQLQVKLEGQVERQIAELTQAKQENERLLRQEQAIRAEQAAALQVQQSTTERLKIALSAAQMGTWDWYLDSPTQHWSPQAASILGFTDDTVEASADRWRERIHPTDLPRIEAALAQAQDNREIFSAEYRIFWPDRSLHWILVQGRFLYAEGKPYQMIGVIQEITAAKQAAITLAANESRFRAVFEQAAVGMARLSPEGCWSQVNSRLCTLLGYEATEMIGQPFQRFTDTADSEQDAHYYQALLSGQLSSCRFEKRYLHKDGDPIWVMVTVSTETDEQGQVLSFIAVIEDIRALKQTTAELEQRAHELEQVNGLLSLTNVMIENRNAELDQFAYVTSHDLKAPLRAIANLSEWIEEDLGQDLPEESRYQMTLLRSRVHRMEALINGLLEYSRVGRQERQVSVVDVRQMLLEIIDLISPPAAFTLSLPDQMPCLKTNQSALSQVFSNLISNAIKHHDREDGTINITATEQDQFVEFTVQDDGPGIAPQYQKKVFTIFQTLKARDELESTGIGLAIVKKTVESEGGTVTLESDAGNGSTFRFTWPRSS